MANYLYNGVELPELPDFSEYATASTGHFDYVIITKYNDEYSLFAVNKPIYKFYRPSPFDDDAIRPIPFPSEYYYCGFSVIEGGWHGLWNPQKANEYSTIISAGDSQIIWSNHDILDYDNGGVYFKGSDPKSPPTPQDFYIVKNGVGQKQDVYLRVGGQSVKLDEYLI